MIYCVKVLNPEKHHKANFWGEVLPQNSEYSQTFLQRSSRSQLILETMNALERLHCSCFTAQRKCREKCPCIPLKTRGRSNLR